MLATGSLYLVSTHEYLAHKALAPHEKVWFTRDDVAHGIDTVVKSAMEWIAEQTTRVAEELDSALPKQFALRQNYPNPFNPSTTIAFELPTASRVTLKVYEANGREVAALVKQRQMAVGNHHLNFSGQGLASGVYYYRLEAEPLHGATPAFVETKAMVLMK